jgi:hypothetical protein
MTRNRPGSHLGDGLRWQIPFHLLDALFYCSEGRAVIDIAFQDSRRAKSVLEKIKVMYIAHSYKLTIVKYFFHAFMHVYSGWPVVCAVRIYHTASCIQCVLTPCTCVCV